MMYPCECATFGVPSMRVNCLVQALDLSYISVSTTIHEMHIRVLFVAVRLFHLEYKYNTTKAPQTSDVPVSVHCIVCRPTTSSYAILPVQRVRFVYNALSRQCSVL